MASADASEPESDRVKRIREGLRRKEETRRAAAEATIRRNAERGKIAAENLKRKQRYWDAKAEEAAKRRASEPPPQETQSRPRRARKKKKPKSTKRAPTFPPPVLVAFSILGVPPGAPPAEVTKAYRRCAKEAHPDAGGSDAAMRELNRAISVLRQAGLAD